MYGGSTVGERGEEERAQREERRHSHQTNDAMSEPVPRLPRHTGVKQAIDWLKLFQEVESGESCVAVADRYGAGGRPLKAGTLQNRLRQWRRARERGDEAAVRRAEGKETTKNQHKMSFTLEEEKELADQIKAEKGEGKMVVNAHIVEQALKFYGERHPRSLRSVTPFACSPHWITRFRRRNGFNDSKHYVRQLLTTDPAERDKQHEDVAQFQLQLQLEDAIQHYGPDHVVNADEMFAKSSIPVIQWASSASRTS